MISLWRPSEGRVRAYLDACGERAFSYDEVGRTRGMSYAIGEATAPAGYVLDHNRVRVGTGEAAFGRARAALLRWAMFDLGWAAVFPPDAPVEGGAVVGVVARTAGVWTVNPTRIVYTFEAGGEVERFGFGYGTLEGHAARGEERFAVEWRRGGDGEVWFDVLAFSRPSAWYARLTRPYMRRLQRRFGADAKAAMRRAVGG